MGTSERFEIAGRAAELLEPMGFTAMARLKDGIVTIELWRGTRGLRYEVLEEHLPPAAVAAAAACVAYYRERVGDG
ncbi:MAG TPA: hypothetical protein VFS00_30370 [Polyangiaceae bacterium]|nr:hypothetical protein [Polyangiaceae bacterium]